MDQKRFKGVAEEIFNKFSCPAFVKKEEHGKIVYWIDPDMCWGCGVCAQIAPKGVIKVKRDEK